MFGLASGPCHLQFIEIHCLYIISISVWTPTVTAWCVITLWATSRQYFVLFLKDKTELVIIVFAYPLSSHLVSTSHISSTRQIVFIQGKKNNLFLSLLGFKASQFFSKNSFYATMSIVCMWQGRYLKGFCGTIWLVFTFV